MFVWFSVFSASWLVSLSMNYPPQSLVSIVVFASCIIICPDKDEKLNILDFSFQMLLFRLLISLKQHELTYISFQNSPHKPLHHKVND